MEPKYLEKWKTPKYYFGETYEDYYVVLSRHRDSLIVDNSNFEMARMNLDELERSLDLSQEEKDQDKIYVIYPSFNHFLVGWIEILMIRVDSPDVIIEEADRIIAALENYPILDEEDYSERELEAQEESYNNWIERDFKTKLVHMYEVVYAKHTWKCDILYLINRYDYTYCHKHCTYLENDIDELFRIRDLFDLGMRLSNTYWEEDSIDVRRIVKSLTYKDLLKCRKEAP